MSPKTRTTKQVKRNNWKGTLDSNQQPRRLRAVCSAELTYSPWARIESGSRESNPTFPGLEDQGPNHRTATCKEGSMMMKERSGTLERQPEEPWKTRRSRHLAECAPPQSPLTRRPFPLRYRSRR